MKRCVTCGIEKPFDAFKARYRTCRDCRRQGEQAYNAARRELQSVYHRRWYEKHAEEIRSKARNRYHANRERIAKQTSLYRKINRVALRQRALEALYGLTPSDFERVLIAQNHLCALCFKRRQLIVDHDHATDEFRGLICAGCNSGIGHLGDDIPGLKAALAYLEGAHLRRQLLGLDKPEPKTRRRPAKDLPLIPAMEAAAFDKKSTTPAGRIAGTTSAKTVGRR